MTLARAQTQTTQFLVELTNHEASAPQHMLHVSQ